MVQVLDRTNPIAALLGRYKKRRGLSVSELARQTERSRTAVRNCLSGKSVGLKSWHGDRLFWDLVASLEIPEREARRAVADHFQLAWIEGRNIITANHGRNSLAA